MLVTNGLLSVASEVDLPWASLNSTSLQGSLQDLMTQELVPRLLLGTHLCYFPSSQQGSIDWQPNSARWTGGAMHFSMPEVAWS